MPTPRPYGSWPSPITPALVVEAAVGLGEVWLDGPVTWWSELRPAEGGRVAVVAQVDGVANDVLSDAWSVRTRVHEYGGGAWWVGGGTLFFTNWDDQRVYRLGAGAGDPVALTRPPAVPHGLRYADGRVSADGRWSVCVRESHEGVGEAVNELVAIPSAGGDPESLVTGADFVSSPRLSPDGRLLAWLQWDHPRMPWDGTELWVAEVRDRDGGLELAGARHVAGGPDESIFQPEWSPEGVLYFVSDRREWWTLHRFGSAGVPQARDTGAPLVDLPAEIGTPQWVFGMSRYAFLSDGGVVFAAGSDGTDHLHVVGAGGVVRDVPSPFTAISQVRASGMRAVFVGASALQEPAVVAVGALTEGADAEIRVLRPPRDLGLDPGSVSRPRHITFPTTGGAVAHALYYPPTSSLAEGPAGTLPPLLVSIHGGPTSAARPQLQLGIQFWTSRGFGVVDVNYRGSTGYGRSYRRALDGSWGIADVDDCAAAAGHLADTGEVDGRHLTIHGGSAGGFTVLRAIATGRFAAGTSSYGVTDLEALARDTHKFESRYLDTLVGPYPERRDLYVERSPIHHLDELRTPLLVLQGLEDEIVPPSQAEMLVEGLRANGVPFAYLAFEGEQHGFRRAETIVRALEAELVFYARVLGFEPADAVEPLEIENL